MKKGMSLTELVVVLLIMATLLIASIPIFYKVRTYSREQSFDEKIDILRAQIAAWHTNELIHNNKDIYPEILDDNPVGEPCTKCFNQILKRPVDDPLWFKKAENEYLFLIKADSGSLNFEGGVNVKYFPESGRIEILKP